MTRIECLKVLECVETASPVDIFLSFKKLRKKYHPDTKVTGDGPSFIRVCEAFDAIKEHFNNNTFDQMDVDDDDLVGTAEEEERRNKVLKCRMSSGDSAEIIQNKIVNSVISKLENSEKLSADIILLPKFYAEIRLRSEQHRLLATLGVGIGFNNNKRRVTSNLSFVIIEGPLKNTTSPTFGVKPEELERIIAAVSHTNFSVEYRMTDRGNLPDFHDIKECTVMREIFEAYPKLDADDLIVGLRIRGKNRALSVSECRSLINNFIQKCIRDGKQTFCVKGPDSITPATSPTVRARWNTEDLHILRDGKVFTQNTDILKWHHTYYLSKILREEFKEIFNEKEKEYKAAVNAKIAEKYKKENDALQTSIDERQALQDLLNKLEVGLLEEK